MCEDASYDYEALEKALSSALASLETLRISRDHLEMAPGRRFSGGYGVVVKATLTGPPPDSNSQVVAVKKLRMGEDDDLRIAVRLVREMKLWAELKHPNIVPFVGFHLGEDVAWLISTWAPNGNVYDFLSNNEVNWPTRLRIVLDVASGLVYLHGMNPPICHGDIKPGNVLITHDLRGMLGDFGLSRALQTSSTGLTTSKTIKGSLRYMGPELLGQDPAHTLASDVWAFGCVTFEVLTGIPPFHSCQSEPQILIQLFQGTSPAVLYEQPGINLDAELQSLLAHCWNMLPDNRPDMTECFRTVQTCNQPSSIELVTGEGWSAMFNSCVFSAVDLQCLTRDVPAEGILLSSGGERYLTSWGAETCLIDTRENTIETRLEAEPARYTAYNCMDARYHARLYEHGIEVWDLSLEVIVFKAQLPPKAAELSKTDTLTIDISGDGKTVAVLQPMTDPSYLYLWNIQSESFSALTIPKSPMVLGFSLSFNGRYAALWSSEGEIQVYNTKSSQLVDSVKEVRTGAWRLVRWFQRCQRMVTTMGQWVKVRDIESSEGVRSVGHENSLDSRKSSWDMSYWHPGEVNSVRVWPDDTLMATICQESRVTVWDLHRKTICLVITMPRSNYYTLCASKVSEKENHFAMALRFGREIWRAELMGEKENTVGNEIEEPSMDLSVL